MLIPASSGKVTSASLKSEPASKSDSGSADMAYTVDGSVSADMAYTLSNDEQLVAKAMRDEVEAE